MGGFELEQWHFAQAPGSNCSRVVSRSSLVPWWNSSRAVLLTFGHLGLQSWWKVIAVEISCFRVSLVTGWWARSACQARGTRGGAQGNQNGKHCNGREFHQVELNIPIKGSRDIIKGHPNIMTYTSSSSLDKSTQHFLHIMKSSHLQLLILRPQLFPQTCD